MKILGVADRNDDKRRTLTAFRPPAEFPNVAEAKVIVTKLDGVKLGNHSHPHHEGFFLATGDCVVHTWSKRDGIQAIPMKAPIMFMFEPNEEHVLVCSAGMVLIGYMPVIFGEENNTPATHLKS